MQNIGIKHGREKGENKSVLWNKELLSTVSSRRMHFIH